MIERERPGELRFREATADDALAVTKLVRRAYERYVERMGRPPGPMLEDYGEVIRDRRVDLAEAGDDLAGLIVHGEGDQGYLIDNVAVDPPRQGRGVGRILIDRAERAALAAGFDSVYLFTHESMTENLQLYGRLGYAEYERRPIDVGEIVFMRRPLR